MNGAINADLLIEGGTIIACDGVDHRLLEGGYVAISGDAITAVGKHFSGTAKRRITARGRIIMPGQISTHAHIGAHEGPRLMIDAGRREFIRSSFLHFLPARRDGGLAFLSRQDARASLRYGFATLLRHGVTTVLAFAPAGPGEGALMLEAAEEFGIRLFWAPVVAGGRYWLESDGRVVRELDDAAGMKSLEASARFVEKHRGALDGRLSGIIALDEYYVSTPALRREAKRVADALNVPFTMHFVEQHREFFETMVATGRTPVQCLSEEGLLDAGTILAHCIYIASHSAVGYPIEDDIAILGASGVNVAHSPVAFSRRGLALESFSRYRRAGVNVALGTDTYPLDMFSEMRMATLMNKFADNNYEEAPAADVFAASNLAGAKALSRPDLGRIAPGAKADIVIVDPNSLAFGPNPDPVRALVHLATPDMIDSVIVAGRMLVEGKRLLVANEEDILAAARASSKSVWASHAAHDILGRGLAERFPPSLRFWDA